jgi:hypothetical protein
VKPDARTLLHAAAHEEALPGSEKTWEDVLFAGEDWTQPAEPSQALLVALAGLHAALADHQATVPARVRAEWLSDVLGIGPLPAVADRVVVAAQADPARTPLTLAAGTAVRAKDTAGTERRYRTNETLTVHGIEVLDVLSHGAERAPGGHVLDRAARWSDRSVPFAPFAAAHPPAVHSLFVLSDLLAFPDGTMTVRLTFGNADPAPLATAIWEFSGPDGARVRATVAKVTTDSIHVQLGGGCAPADVLGVQAPYLCASLPAGQRSGEALAFAPATVRVGVAKREHVRPDRAYANDGRLDSTKEMQPFGPTPKRGDAFYVCCDEAFGKPLSSLTVHLGLLDPTSGALMEVPWSSVPFAVQSRAKEQAQQTTNQDVAKGIKQVLGYLEESSKSAPEVDWQYHDGRAWAHLQSTGTQLKTLSWAGATAPTQPRSRTIDLDGPGHFLRAFLAAGDFGWSAYQRNLADFAAKAATPGGKPSASLLIAPDPPILSAISIDYATVDTTPRAVASVDGWTTRHPPASGPYHAFALPFELSGDSAGMLAVGLRVGQDALGTALALYVDVASASACGSDPDSPLRWEYWTAAGWRALDVADGTLGLRQPGLLRFVAPLDWPEGSEGASASAGRWIRAVTPSPDTVGTLLAIVPDAVEAVQDTPPDAPAGAYEPLAAGQVKGLLIAAPGIKKLTNPIAGRPGRAIEDTRRPGFLVRASGAVRHRGRAATAWDCEALIRDTFPEVAAVRALPHTNPQGEDEPGWIAAVVVPRTTDRMPLPSVSLAARIAMALDGRLPVHAELAVLCPIYVPVTVHAAILLAPGAAAVDARTRITAALEHRLHPTATDPVRFGRELFASSVAAELEALPDVDHLETFALLAGGAPTERVAVDPCRGIVASAGDHVLTLTERL